MKIIKDRKIIEDNWTYLSDTHSVQNGNITVSPERWQNDRKELLNRNGNLGLRLGSVDSLDHIKNDLENFKLIELNFSVFTDGRGFSQAWMLRNRYQYKGELRAVGHFMLDQMYYLNRVGFNSFNPENPTDLQGALKTLDDFTIQYQVSTC